MGYFDYLRKISVGGQPALICRPSGRHYGHCALELLMAFTFGRLTGMRVYTVQPNPVVNPALFEVKLDDVDIVRCTGWRSRWLKMRWTLTESEAFAVALSTELAYETHRYAQRKYLPALLIRWFKALSFWLDARGDSRLFIDTENTPPDPQKDIDEFHQAKNAKLYLFRRNIEQPLNTYLPADLCADLRERLSQLGVQPGTKMVTVHARESGFHRGEEMQDASAILLERRKGQHRKLDNRTDVVRNARIDSYSQAIDYLVNEGYAVVRLGDPLMEPYQRAGLVDLATSPIRSPALELYCLSQSEFVLCGESGPYSVSYLTNTPSVLVNATDPISGYPVRKDRLYILKQVHDRVTGQPLRLNDMLTHQYLTKMRQLTPYQYVDNTSDEILVVVREMVSGLRNGWVTTLKQRAYREQATATAIEFNKRERHGGIAYVRKWGEDRGFLGSGYIGADLAERNFQIQDG